MCLGKTHTFQLAVNTEQYDEVEFVSDQYDIKEHVSTSNDSFLVHLKLFR